MQIAEVSPADVDAITALWEEAGLTRPWNQPAADLHRALNGTTSTVLGAFTDDRLVGTTPVGTALVGTTLVGTTLVGTVMVGHDGHRGWVYYLAVAESERGAGLGRRLMQAAESWLREHGAVKLQLMVRDTNTHVIGFYDRLGYADADVRVLAKRLD